MLDANTIEKRYEFWMYINMAFTLLCFSFAAEKYYLIAPFLGGITLVYMTGRPISHKMFEIAGFITLIVVFRIVQILSDGDTLFAGGGVLIGTYFLFFFREKKYRSSPINLLMILGLMLISTFLLDRFQYVFFFIPFSITIILLLRYSLLFKESPNLTNIHILEKPQKTHISFSLGRLITSSLLVGLALSIAFLVFVFIPRSHRWELKGSENLSMGRTGFNAEMTSASMKSILADPNTFFIVETSNSQDYFQGAVYDTFDGQNWYTTLEKQEYSDTTRLHFDNVKINVRNENFSFQNAPENTIFYRKPLVYIKIDRKYVKNITIDKADNISIEDPKLRKNFSYSIVVATSDVIDPETTTESYHDWVKQHYLQLPGSISKRVKELAKTVIQNTTETKMKATQISNYLQQNYKYTLNMSPGKNEVTDYFLFDAKKGYCIHFATAMTIMLRSQGIPARVAGGFRPGKYENGHCVISNEDAHAWVEVYEPQKGWMFFDPTPGQEDYLIGLDFWLKIYYKMYVFWSHNVVSFSSQQQREIYAWLKEKFILIKNNLHIIVFLFILFYGIKSINKNKRKTQALLPKQKKKIIQTAKENAIFVTYTFYSKMLDILQKLSISKQLQETPVEFITRINIKTPEIYPYAKIITDIFCETQFGHREFNQHKKSLLEENIKKLEEMSLGHVNQNTNKIFHKDTK